ncbi:hypothetical protein C8P68_101175 [Mucilaginibacter yixingensis]|uniref:Uncharacterized protein n=1 Tax=Mucilaginibacter yixingensis TaxID=1295612 RepID=A0A2T5JEW8_9SPHI|nr:hypothetical protein [Mucilaginibacter yixingensis]PTR00945.1 hypothetical protein C8P68_101175 [Mucilaginibacter yixingensis]
MDEAALIETKVEELVALLHKNPPGQELALAIKQKINAALDETAFSDKIEAFEKLDTNQSRLDMLDDLELLLSQHQLDSRASQKYLYGERIKKSMQIIIALTMMVLGIGMIVIPTPGYFEIYTLYYFNPNDGITVMDVISLLIIFCGVYLLINALIKKNKS